MNCSVDNARQTEKPAAWMNLITWISALVATAMVLPCRAGTESRPALSAGIPLFFEADSPDAPSCFLARTPVAQFLVGPSELRIALTRFEAAPAPAVVGRGLPNHARSASTHVARLQLVGASQNARVQGAAGMPGKINYIIGNDPAKWRTGLPSYAQVKVTSVYPGIDVLYYGNERQLEYDFTVAAGADPSAIRFKLEGVEQVLTNSAGELILRLGDGEVRQRAPGIYQVVDGARRQIRGGYKLPDAHTVAFDIGSYDHRLPLIIDPMFDYSTYFGGNGNDAALAIKVDTNGNVYIAGQTVSTQFGFTVPTNAFQRTFQGGAMNGDAFVAKLNSAGNQLLYFTYLGSPGEDGALDMAIDTAGNAYLVGFTDSSAFPVRNALYPHIHGNADPNLGVYPNDVFVAELNTNGSALVFSTFFGGSGTDIGSAIAVDPAGYVYIAGYTYSVDLPTGPNSFQRYLQGTDDAFVAKFAPGGTNLVYTTYLGGTGVDEGEGIAADGQGCAYVTGYTISSAFPITANAWQTNFNNTTNGFASYDAFVTKIGPFGSNLVFSTFLGGLESDYGYRIALDAHTNVYVTGTSISRDFPTTGPVYGLSSANANTNNAVNFDAFLTRYDSAGHLTFSTLFGGTGTDAGWDVAVDPTGRAFVIGTTLSTNFPVVSPFGLFSATPPAGTNVFVTAFSTNGLAARYSAYLSGSGGSYGYGIAVDAESSAYITGLTYANNFPTTAAPFQSSARGAAEAFIAKIRLMDPNLTVSRVGNDVVLSWPASAPQYVLQAATALVPPVTWTTVTQPPPVLVGGFYTLTLGPTNDFSFFRLQRQ